LRLALDEKVAALARAMTRAHIPHAFGGAIALAYYATPRGTHDVDINVFVPARDFDRVLESLLPLGIDAPTPALRRALARDEQVRLGWDETPLDLFFSYAALHDECLQRRREVPFGSERITILGPEDLAIFKVLFDRAKDWRDLAELLFAQGERFDRALVLGWLERILEAGDERLVRFAALLAAGDVGP
jgi:hypothetical protein